MEQFDPEREQQVWQRVLGGRESGGPQISLQKEAAALCGQWRQLSSRLAGKQRELARQLYEGEQANLAALQGLAALSGGGTEVLKLWPPSREPAERQLISGYHRTRRCLVEYMSRAAESEWGPVYQLLAQRTQRQLELIARLLGMMRA